MNKEWSELNKQMQTQLKKKDTFEDGIDSLIELRNEVWDVIASFKRDLKKDDFNAIPFLKADGLHNKTIAYSLWHVFRIEDIVAHDLVKGDEEVFFKKGYDKKIGSPIITTGNELFQNDIADFSKQLDLKELYAYILDVKKSSEKILKELTYEDLKRKIPADKKEYLKSLHVVSEDESAVWLIDYWCDKDIRGLIQMPFSRHWIMHTEACLRIKSKIIK